MNRNQRKFKATAKHVRAINVNPHLSRGGICL